MRELTMDTNKKVVSVATAMLHGDISLIEGCRKISGLRYNVSNPDHEVFLTIRGVDSETDHFPIGDLRKQYAPEYLQRLDKEMEDYIARVRDNIIASCHEIIRVFS